MRPPVATRIPHTGRERRRVAEDDRSRGVLRAQPHEVARGVERIALSLVNAYLVGEPGAPTGKWALVDAGLSTSVGTIIDAAALLSARRPRWRSFCRGAGVDRPVTAANA